VFVTTACEASIPYAWNRPPFEGANELHSLGVYVVDVENGKTVFAKNENMRMNPASTIKIMTALVTLEVMGELLDDELIQVPGVVFEGFNTSDPNTVGGSLAGLTLGQSNLTYRDALYGLMLPSGNDAANVLAYNVGGFLNAVSSIYDPDRSNIETFVKKMNEKAAEIGCVDTSFSNAHGLLEEGNWSCAYDLAIIALYAYDKFPLFREISAATEYFMPGNNRVNSDGYWVRNSNGMMFNSDNNPFYRDYVQGIKNGALDEIWYREIVSEDTDDDEPDDLDSEEDEHGEWVKYDGIANLVSLGEINGRLYIISTLEAPYKHGHLSAGETRLQYSYIDHIALYDWLLNSPDPK
jgi:D-alanyl-D-alanine carboxypeptidase (penicillin-binding protein 5/6)